ncbi:protein kinase family protein [Micromonospora sp. NPDC005324]|uniref:protein kinase family protein n=1 Tax=Micromonospora sp. NPDC005324 TaxID=3157033 RepID=UPI0033BE5EF9
MATPEELMLQDLVAKYADIETDLTYSRLYPEGTPAARIFSHLHARLDALLEFMNSKARTNRHFNAHESRELLALIDEIEDSRTIFRRVGAPFEFDEDYGHLIEECKKFLQESNGSQIPDDFRRIKIKRYEPVFRIPGTEIQIPGRWKNVKLKMIGQGAFAFVYSYTDPEYGTTVALKRAKAETSAKDVIRFRQEFEILKSLRFPYILEVYRYSPDRNEYTMEHCDSTLEKYISVNNANLSFGIRKRVALQFLYGLNYLHSKGHLHRDISYRNILIKRYDGFSAVVKLSDFGLVKERGSRLTRTESELRGTILDPTIRSFRDYSVLNEIYAVGFVLSFIFSGRTHITACSGGVRHIVDRCVVHDHSVRYQDVRSIIADVEALAADSSSPALETPA